MQSFQLIRVLALSVSMVVACEDAEHRAPGREQGGLFASKTGVRTRLKTRLGEIEGALLRKTRAFFGIPYAQPPVGRLRFSPPKPAEAWTGIRDASAFGPMCPQPQVGPLALDYPMDEDCLTLNVYTPDLSTGKPLPVMIFIHGGGFVFGSSRSYTPERLSEAGPVVVVTIQYRLGPLGFLTHPALDALRDGTPPGNDGLRDQQLAVEWVKQNIADYGGNPDNVTLFGESTGSTSVCFHMVMPGSQGLAARAIMQSNECSIVNRALTRNEADALSEELAKSFCAAASGDELINCLRQQDPFDLSAFGSELPDMPGTLKNLYGNPGWNAVVDGADGILPESAATLFARGEFAHIPLMLGTTKRETALWRSLNVAPHTFSSTSELEAFWTASSDAKLAAAIMAAYRTGPDEDPNETFDRMVSDIQVRCPTRKLARMLSRQGNDVYLYSFEAGDALHGDDLKFLFGTVGAAALTSSMKGFWTQFARTGDPNALELPSWPRYTQDNDAHMILDESSLASTELARDECDLWDQVELERGEWIRP